MTVRPLLNEPLNSHAVFHRPSHVLIQCQLHLPGGGGCSSHRRQITYTRSSLSVFLIRKIFFTLWRHPLPQCVLWSQVAFLKYTLAFVSVPAFDFASLSFSSSSPSLFLSIFSFSSFSVLFSFNHSFLGSCHSPDLPSSRASSFGLSSLCFSFLNLRCSHTDVYVRTG